MNWYDCTQLPNSLSDCLLKNPLDNGIDSDEEINFGDNMVEMHPLMRIVMQIGEFLLIREIVFNFVFCSSICLQLLLMYFSGQNMECIDY